MIPTRYAHNWNADGRSFAAADQLPGIGTEELHFGVRYPSLANRCAIIFGDERYLEVPDFYPSFVSEGV